MAEPFFTASASWLRPVAAFVVATGATVGVTNLGGSNEDQSQDTTAVAVLAPVRTAPAATIEEAPAAVEPTSGGGASDVVSEIELPPGVGETFEARSDPGSDGPGLEAPPGAVPNAAETFGFLDPCADRPGGCPVGEAATVLGRDAADVAELPSYVFEIRVGAAALAAARCAFPFGDSTAVPLLVITTNPGDFTATYGPAGGAPAPDAPHEFTTADAERAEWRRWERSGRPVFSDGDDIEDASFVHTCTSLPGAAVAPGEPTDWEVTVDGTFSDGSATRTAPFQALVVDPDGGAARPPVTVTPTGWGYARVAVPVDTSSHESVRVAFVAILLDDGEADPGTAACGAATDGDFVTLRVPSAAGDRVGGPREIPSEHRDADGYPYDPAYDAVVDVDSPALTFGRPHEVCVEWQGGDAGPDPVAIRVIPPNAIIWGVVMNSVDFGPTLGRPEDVLVEVGTLSGSVRCEYRPEGTDHTAVYVFDSPAEEPCVGPKSGRPADGPEFGRGGVQSVAVRATYLDRSNWVFATYPAETCVAPAVCGSASSYDFTVGEAPDLEVSFTLWTYADGVPPSGASWIISGERAW